MIEATFHVEWRGRIENRALNEMVRLAVEKAREAGCAWLHVDFEDHLRAFYEHACGFTTTSAGLVNLETG